MSNADKVKKWYKSKLQSLLWSRAKRWMLSLSVTGWLLIPVLFTLLQLTLPEKSSMSSFSMMSIIHDFIWLHWKFVLVVLVIFIPVIIMQVRVEYRRRTYDPVLVLKYQDIFFDTMKSSRLKAASALLSGKELTAQNRDAVYEVLGIFDDLGFHESGGQVSAEVVHQHLYNWIRGYYQASKDFIKSCRGKELSDLEYVEELFHKTSQVESERSHRRIEDVFLSPSALKDFLESEARTNTEA